MINDYSRLRARWEEGSVKEGTGPFHLKDPVTIPALRACILTGEIDSEQEKSSIIYDK